MAWMWVACGVRGTCWRVLRASQVFWAVFNLCSEAETTPKVQRDKVTCLLPHSLVWDPPRPQALRGILGHSMLWEPGRSRCPVSCVPAPGAGGLSPWAALASPLRGCGRVSASSAAHGCPGEHPTRPVKGSSGGGGGFPHKASCPQASVLPEEAHLHCP